jgi:hypothetical protein
MKNATQTEQAVSQTKAVRTAVMAPLMGQAMYAVENA